MKAFGAIIAHIAAATGQPFSPAPARRAGGGCINEALTLSDGDRRWFVKINRPERLPMFEAEAAGLAEMAATGTVRVPEPLCTGKGDGQAYIVMEHIDLGGRPRDGGAEAGRLLAAMHRSTRDSFGWDRDNTIGATPQPNTPNRDWVEFFRDHRLAHQLRLAARNGHGGRLQSSGEALLAEVPRLICHQPPPSLLHGDLWGGNMGHDPAGRPVLYDPAVYYGDREADIAMTELFGGFGGAFHAAYRETWPLEAGYSVRRTLYNLYHILNHLNLFGGGYLGQAQTMVDRLLSETR